jgi:triphosphoribosyl-dephospho-CoA synthase
MRSVAENAELALLLEVSSTPKPGNVDRRREYPDLRFEHFVTGAVGTREGFEMAGRGDPLGRAFERAVAGMSEQQGGNTQFGAVLNTIPLVAAAGRGDLSADGVSAVVAETTVEDAVAFYEAFEHVDVAVDDPPPEMEPLDVRRGAEAAPAIRERELTLADIMEQSDDRDDVAAEWTGGHRRTFEAAHGVETGSGPVTTRGAAVFLALLSQKADTFVLTQHDEETAREVRDRADAVLDGEESVTEFADELVDREINPGTTADIVAGGLFVALERGLEV